MAAKKAAATTISKDELAMIMEKRRIEGEGKTVQVVAMTETTEEEVVVVQEKAKSYKKPKTYTIGKPKPEKAEDLKKPNVRLNKKTVLMDFVGEDGKLVTLGIRKSKAVKFCWDILSTLLRR